MSSPDLKDAKRLVASFEPTRFDWSPDGKWVVYSKSDDDFNEDIWLAPVDGSREPFNLSRHPDNEVEPGLVARWRGHRVHRPEDRHRGRHLLRLAQGRGRREVEPRANSREGHREDEVAEDRWSSRRRSARSRTRCRLEDRGRRGQGRHTRADGDPAETPKKPVPNVVIDFDRIHERIRHVSIPDSTETGLFWSPDSKKLAFTGSVDGKTGVYSIEFPEDLKPKPLTTQTGSQARWLEAGNQIVWLSAGVPASFSASGRREAARRSYRFRALQEVNWPRQVPRGVRPLLANDARPLLRRAPRQPKLGRRPPQVCRHGRAITRQGDVRHARPAHARRAERLASGFSAATGQGPARPPGPGPRRGPRGPGAPVGPGTEGAGDPRWNVTTAHFGLRFEPGTRGRVLKVRDVIPGTPADHKATRIVAGEILLAVDGTTVDPHSI